MGKRTYEHYGTLENMAEAWNKAADDHLTTVCTLFDHAEAHGLGFDFVRNILKEWAYRPWTDAMMKHVENHHKLLAEELALKDEQ